VQITRGVDCEGQGVGDVLRGVHKTHPKCGVIIGGVKRRDLLGRSNMSEGGDRKQRIHTKGEQ
jgi:hypothetical protein